MYIQDVLSKTESSKKETIASWTETYHDAMEISRVFFKFTDLCSSRYENARQRYIKSENGQKIIPKYSV